MGIDRDFAKGSASVVEEVEAELERLLDRKRDDLERGLSGRFKQEEQAVPTGPEEPGRREPAVGGPPPQPAAADTEFRALLEEIRDRFKRVLHCQTEIEKLTRLTTEEITRVFELLGKAGELRARLLEERRPHKPAAYEMRREVPRDFQREAAPVPEPEAEVLPPDLRQALERVRKIKELLTVEAIKKRDLDRSPAGLREPEPLLPVIQDLVAEPAVVGPPSRQELPPEPVRPAPEPAPGLDVYRRSEPASARGEVYYFQKGRRIILDTARIMEAAEKSRAEAKRLILKLGQTDSSPDQFMLRQGIISWQEGFRRIVLQIVKMSEKNRLDFPEFTADALNIGVFRELLERLSLSDWSRPEDFAAFEKWLVELRDRLGTRSASADSYRSSVLSELEED